MEMEMNNRSVHNDHTLDHEWLIEYAAGGLSLAKRVVIACQAALNGDVHKRLRAAEEISASFLETAHGDQVSEQFFDKLHDQLDASAQEYTDEIAERSRSSLLNADNRWAPGPLSKFIAEMGDRFEWKSVGRIERAVLGDFDGDRLYLLKARGGTKLPHHSHTGEEWTLVLQGGYHAGGVGFGPGDLHREDADCHHQPIIDAGEDCISLVADEGRLRFSNPLLKAAQPFIGI